MNNYYQSFIDKFEKVRSKEELTRTFDICCGGLKDVHGNEIVGGCRKQAFCDQTRCQVYREYVLWLNIIDEVRKPTVVYVEGEKPRQEVFKKTRDYKIKPATQCRQVALIQIAKLEKKDSSEVLQKIKEHIINERFKRAYNLSVKSNYVSIANTIGKHIGVLGAESENN